MRSIRKRSSLKEEYEYHLYSMKHIHYATTEHLYVHVTQSNTEESL